ncbi:MAG: hypothetical protein PHE17_04555 [Thiothrix sp.]|uniref:hypothetical protein n=1 Tax=Thiothrix sp. TaxID=1032 RepID=UPI00262DB538|nr:hypothetical protein [Thiothrix sp.]MDD5392270.1 hypothetical protein [Thiothrix sp.]
MNEMTASATCTVPSEVLKASLLVGVIGVVSLTLARLAGVGVPMSWALGLIVFFFVGAILVLHWLSILRKPGLVLLVGTLFIVGAVYLQDTILGMM